MRAAGWVRSIALLAISLPTLTGCWARWETNELAIVSGYAVDFVHGQYVITASVYNPRMVAAPGTSSTSGSEPETLLLMGTASTVAHAVDAVSKDASRHVMWDTTDIVLIGEPVARRGIGNLLDALTHQPWFRPTQRFVVVPGLAQAVLTTRNSGMEISVPLSLGAHALIEQYDESRAYAPYESEVLLWQAEHGRSYLLPMVEPVKPTVPTEPSFRFGPSAVVTGRESRMVAAMPEDLVRQALWIQGLFVHGSYPVPCAGRLAVSNAGEADIRDVSADAGEVDLQGVHQRVGPVLDAHGHLVRMRVLLEGRGILGHSCPGLTTQALSDRMSLLLYGRTAATIRWAQEHGTDVFGFGESVYRHAPRTYEALGGDRMWPEVFAHLPVALEVHVRIPETGMVRT